MTPPTGDTHRSDLEGALDEQDPVTRPHTGTWRYHDDDCRCGWYDGYCNRDGNIWSCCGACKQHSDCAAPNTHPTFWSHPRHAATVAGYRNNWPFYKSNAEIRAASPDSFADSDDRSPSTAGD